jgi:hypothetical protein
MAKMLVDVSSKMGRLIPVVNQKRMPAACSMYVAVRVENCDGRHERTLLLTKAEMRRIERRARRNPEDCLVVGKLRDLLD